MSVTERPLPPRAASFTDEELAAARLEVSRAFALRGAVTEDGNPVCLSCGEGRRGKVKLFADGGWHCRPCGAHGDAIGVLRDAGWSFPAAVLDLLGRPARRPADIKPAAKLPAASAPFTATLDVEVYQALLATGSLEAAVAFYAGFKISPQAVAESGAVYVEDPYRAARTLVREFGVERLVASGLALPAEQGKGTRLLVNAQYPIVEPHRRADGAPTGLQFRASPEQAAKVEAHKRGEGAYVPKFLSLRGAGTEHLLGCGLPRLAGLRPGTQVRICEGFKDLLAARSMGWEAYALPGAGTAPPPAALEVLRRHRLMLMFDGDDAGQAGAERLTDRLREAGCSLVRAKLPAGMDIADMLARFREKEAAAPRKRS